MYDAGGQALPAATAKADHRARPGGPRNVIVFLYLPVLACLAAVAALSHAMGIPISALTRDPTAVAGVHPLTGLVSNLGILLWCASAALCLFSATVLHRTGADRATHRLIFWAGIVTVVLLLDDLFLLHERIYPAVFGVGERAVFGVYGAMLLTYFSVYRNVLARTDPSLLVVALACFGVSLIVDQGPESILPAHLLFEDGFKFLGIASWFGYFSTLCYEQLRSVT